MPNPPRKLSGSGLNASQKVPPDTGSYSTEIKVGEKISMGFRRQTFTWTSAHIPGGVIKQWEGIADMDGDRILRSGMSPKDFEHALFEEGVADMPDWVDWDLLDTGCRFFVTTWPFVMTGFFWAMLGGFGSESASTVLLESRYWARAGHEGRRDTFLRLRETACWLFDIAAHGKQGFHKGGISWQACLHVRYLHCRTRMRMWNAGSWNDERVEKYGQPINQGQLIGTLLGSSVLLLQGMEEMAGMLLPQKSKEGFIHLWRVVGFLFGIEESLNPNTSFDRALITTQSVLRYGINPFPDMSITGVLTKHICSSVAQGVQEESKFPVESGTIAVPAWYFLGKEYGQAIGLPRPSWLGWVAGLGRIYLLKSALLLFWLPGAAQVLEPIARRLFASLVVGIRSKQPCAFGANAAAAVHRTSTDSRGATTKGVCPFGFKSDTACCAPPPPSSEEMARITSKLMPTII
eukprot:TRINITY_DN71804_c0_g1_i1.p1 TRINITY_DN71804_c0_g1~~TRINITY_DN71804_c0_g1_i1.p1  ORF type:complete len:478 (+),score=46.61 TRINITY_DN71804_c0_g1_i1:51-1436(+)